MSDVAMKVAVRVRPFSRREMVCENHFYSFFHLNEAVFFSTSHRNKIKKQLFELWTLLL